LINNSTASELILYID